MKDKNKTKEQLIKELEELRQRIDKLEASKNERVQAEKTLRESEEKFRNLADQSPNMIFIYKKDRIAYANKKCEEVMGYTREEFYTPDFDFRTLIAPESRKKIEAAFVKHMKSEDVEPYEYTIVTRDGRRIEVINAPKIIVFEGESAILGIVTDIIERKRAEEELKKTKEFLDNLVESSLDIIMVTDDKGCITRVNKALLDLLGYNKEEVLGKHIAELSIKEKGIYRLSTGESIEFNENFFNDQKELISKLIEEGKIKNRESYFIRKDLVAVSFEQNMFCLYNEKGDIIAVVGLLRDITERRKKEKEIHESKDFLENIFKTSVDGIMITSKGIITMVNEALEKMLGYSKDELIGQHSMMLSPQGERYQENGKQIFSKLFKEGIIIGEEMAWLKKGGGLIDIEVNAALLKDSTGNITGSVSNIRDITERKQAEKEQTKTKDYLDFSWTVVG
jgi:PAS domain S-box-containing protein